MSIDKQKAFALALRFMSREEQETLWEYIVLTDYGSRYVALERQTALRTLLRQLMQQEQLDMLDLPARLQQLARIKSRTIQEHGPFLELFAESA